MSSQQFQELVKTYRRATGYSQKALADALGLHQQVLSRKIGAIGAAHLNHVEIKKIVQTLAEWNAISTHDQAVELLSLVNLKPSIFSDAEWESFPLNQLEKKPTGRQLAVPVPATTLHFNNLPVPLTSLVGREGVVEEVGRMLNRPATRLLSLLGPGGCGKTRRAIEVGRVFQANFKQGVCFVNLAAVTDPAWVGVAIFEALGLMKSDTLDHRQNLKYFLREQQLLLILDNFEHVTGATGLIEDLLQSSPGLKIIITSRVVLRLYGEQEFTVPALELPGPEEAADFANLAKIEAVRLFVERAQAVRPDFSLTPENGPLVAEICRRLSGLPLALELAASRTKLLSLPLLLNRLSAHKLDILGGGANNLPERHKTLRNTLDWSYRLLAPHEKQLFRGLGIFRGSFSVEAVQAVCGEVFGGQANDTILVLNELGNLLDESLVQPAPPGETASGFAMPGNRLVASTRFRLLEALREYALELLHAAGEQPRLRLAQVHYYREFSRTAEKQLDGPDHVAWLNLLDTEYPNIRAALDTLLDMREDHPDELILGGLDMCNNLSTYWDIRGYYGEARLLINQFLAAARANGLAGTLGYAWAMSRAGLMTGRLGEFGKSQEILVESLDLMLKLGDRQGEATAIFYQGLFTFLSGDYRQTRRHFTQSESISRELDDERILGEVLINKSILEKSLGHLDSAYEMLRQSLRIFKELGNKRQIAACLNHLGGVVELRQEYAASQVYFTESLQLYSEQGEYRGLCSSYRGLAVVAYFEQDYDLAYKHMVESLKLSYRIGDKIQIGVNLALLAILNVTKFEHGLLANSPEERLEFLRGTARVIGSSDAQFKEAQAVINPVYKEAYETRAQSVRAWLGEADFSQHYLKGMTTSLAVVVAGFS